MLYTKSADNTVVCIVLYKFKKKNIYILNIMLNEMLIQILVTVFVLDYVKRKKRQSIVVHLLFSPNKDV